MSDEIIKTDLNSDKTPARPSHDALNHPEHQSHIDKVADAAASRAGNRLKSNEGTNPGTSEFTK